MGYRTRQTPSGARDVVGDEWRWQRAVEERMLRTFAAWGYDPVATPTFEYEEALTLGNHAGLADKMFRFFDREGHVLALRPEMTTPIGRVVATRLRGRPLPLRLCYVAHVFRYEQPQAGWQREFCQAGVELVGSDRPEADAEVIALAACTLMEAGLRDVRIDIGHVGFYEGLAAALGAEGGVAAEVRRALVAHDYVALEEAVAGARLAGRGAERLLALPLLRGGLEVLDRAEELLRPGPGEEGNEGLARARRALAELRAVAELLAAYGVADRIGFDLALLKDLDYYTGIVLEGYTPELGFSLCTGGRYDQLLGKFGFPCPATGFAVGVERVLLALQRQGVAPPRQAPDLLLGAAPGASALLAAVAMRLRRCGWRVEAEVSGRDRQALAELAAARGIPRVGYVGALPAGIRAAGPGAPGSLAVEEMELAEPPGGPWRPVRLAELERRGPPAGGAAGEREAGGDGGGESGGGGLCGR